MPARLTRLMSPASRQRDEFQTQPRCCPNARNGPHLAVHFRRAPDGNVCHLLRDVSPGKLYGVNGVRGPEPVVYRVLEDLPKPKPVLLRHGSWPFRLKCLANVCRSNLRNGYLADAPGNPVNAPFPLLFRAVAPTGAFLPDFQEFTGYVLQPPKSLQVRLLRLLCPGVAPVAGKDVIPGGKVPRAPKGQAAFNPASAIGREDSKTQVCYLPLDADSLVEPRGSLRGRGLANVQPPTPPAIGNLLPRFQV